MEVESFLFFFQGIELNLNISFYYAVKMSLNYSFQTPYRGAAAAGGGKVGWGGRGQEGRVGRAGLSQGE